MDTTSFLVHSELVNPLFLEQYVGSSVDWMEDKAEVDFPLVIYVKGGKEEGSEVSNDEILENVMANFEGIKAAALSMRKRLNLVDSRMGSGPSGCLAKRIKQNHTNCANNKSLFILRINIVICAFLLFSKICKI